MFKELFCWIHKRVSDHTPFCQFSGKTRNYDGAEDVCHISKYVHKVLDISADGDKR